MSEFLYGMWLGMLGVASFLTTLYLLGGYIVVPAL